MTTEITTKMRQVVTNSAASNLQVNRGATVAPDSTKKLGGARQELPISRPSIAPSKQADKTTAQPLQQTRLDQIVDDLNTYVQNLRREIRFSVDERSGRPVITVIDEASQEIVRQIPPEEIVAVSRNFSSHAGIFVSANV